MSGATGPLAASPTVAWVDSWTPPGGWLPEPGHVLAEAAPPGPPLDPDQLPDIGHMRAALDEALARLSAEWVHLSDAQKQQLVDQVYLATERGHVTDLTDLQVPVGATTAALTAAMVAIAVVASRQLAAEAADQGVEVGVVHLPTSVFQPIAEVVATMLADELRISAARAALRTGPEATAAEVAQAVSDALAALSTASPEKELGGALHGSMNTARAATLRSAPAGALYANEVNDTNTCKPCKAVNGRWLGNTDDLAAALALYPAGGYGGYIDCLGGIRCRGTIVGVWRPKQAGPQQVAPRRLRGDYNPAQRRDEHGRWSRGGAVIAKVLELADGTIEAATREDGVHLDLTNKAGDENSAGVLDRRAAWGLADLLEQAADRDGEDRRITNSVHTFAGKDQAATGFAQVSSGGGKPIAVELLDNDHQIELTPAEAKRLSATLEHQGAASRVQATTGPVDIYLTDGNQFGLRTKGTDGDTFDMHFKQQDWAQLRAALNAVWEGFDESGDFGHDPEDHINELQIHTGAGDFLISRGGKPGADADTLSIRPAHGDAWAITWPADHRHPMFDAFEAVERIGGDDLWDPKKSGARGK